MRHFRIRPKIISTVLVLLYSCGLTSYASVHLLHDFFHLLEQSVHWHDHVHHHQSYTSEHSHAHKSPARTTSETESAQRPTKNNSAGEMTGHEHGRLIDGLLEAIDAETKLPESHQIYLLEFYNHLKIFAQIEILNQPGSDKNPYSGQVIMSTQFYPIPAEPPPRNS